eukprot:COSAG01_NODE_8063_length_2934_cov_4.053968_1_plen_404_part_00
MGEIAGDAISIPLGIIFGGLALAAIVIGCALKTPEFFRNNPQPWLEWVRQRCIRCRCGAWCRYLDFGLNGDPEHGEGERVEEYPEPPRPAGAKWPAPRPSSPPRTASGSRGSWAGTPVKLRPTTSQGGSTPRQGGYGRGQAAQIAYQVSQELEADLRREIDSAVEAQCRAAFARFDRDRSGSLEVEELPPLVQELAGKNMTHDEVNEAIRDMDKDRTGEIDAEEFVLWWVGKYGGFLARAEDADEAKEAGENGGDVMAAWRALRTASAAKAAARGMVSKLRAPGQHSEIGGWAQDGVQGQEEALAITYEDAEGQLQLQEVVVVEEAVEGEEVAVGEPGWKDGVVVDEDAHALVVLSGGPEATGEERTGLLAAVRWLQRARLILWLWLREKTRRCLSACPSLAS